MRIRNKKDLVAGLAMIVTGLVFAIGSTAYRFGTSIKPGPGYFPFGLGIILAILGLVIVATAFVSGDENDDPISNIPWRPLLCVSGAIVLFGATLPRLGFFISFPLMTIVTAYASTEFKWLEATVNALVLLALCWLIFIFGLELNIPLWPSL